MYSLRPGYTLKGVYHCDDEHFALAKDLGFTHVEIAMGAWPGVYEHILPAVRRAHRLGLNCIIDPGFKLNISKALFLLQEGWGDGTIANDDIIHLFDEPNNYKVSPAVIEYLSKKTKEVVPIKTMITLDYSDPVDGYENSADILALDYYARKSDWIRHAQIAWRFLGLRLRHKGATMAVPPLKRGEMRFWGHFWRFLGARGRYWYSWTPDQENRDSRIYSPLAVHEDLELQKEIRRYG